MNLYYTDLIERASQQQDTHDYKWMFHGTIHRFRCRGSTTLAPKALHKICMVPRCSLIAQIKPRA